MTAPPCEVVINGENQDTLETVVHNMMVALFSCFPVCREFWLTSASSVTMFNMSRNNLSASLCLLKLNSSSVSLQVSEVDALIAACCHGGAIAE